MISKIKFYAVAVSILALGVFAGSALAQDTTTAPNQGQTTQRRDKFERRGGFGRRDGAGPRHAGPEAMLREFRDLNLTDTQKAQIKSILDANKPDQATMDQMKALRESRKNGTELTADQKAQLKALRQQQAQNMRSVHEQVMNVLSPEQKAQLEQKRQEMKQRWEQRDQQKQTAAPKTDKPISE
jgi:protein CpxP